MPSITSYLEVNGEPRFYSYWKYVATWIVCCLLWPISAAFADPSPTEIVANSETALWGKTVAGDVDMTITTPEWSRTVTFNIWRDGTKKSFIRMSAPAKDLGIASLKIDFEMWNYLPAIERTVKIPPSLMLQPWFGSDFTNDDLLKESSVVNDYNHRLMATSSVEGNQIYQVESLPKPDAAVTWGKIVRWIRKSDFVPYKMEFYDGHGELSRTLNYSDIRPMGGHTIPTRWEMVPAGSTGKKTTIVIKNMIYDKPVSADIFSQRNLKQKG